jgi:hypothetical protein
MAWVNADRTSCADLTWTSKKEPCKLVTSVYFLVLGGWWCNCYADVIMSLPGLCVQSWGRWTFFAVWTPASVTNHGHSLISSSTLDLDNLMSGWLIDGECLRWLKGMKRRMSPLDRLPFFTRLVFSVSHPLIWRRCATYKSPTRRQVFYFSLLRAD